MMRRLLPLMCASFFCGAACSAPGGAPLGDLYAAPEGNVYVYPVGHGSVMLSWNGNVIQIDPYGQAADYSALPKADLVLITHDHADHLDPSALTKTVKEGTRVIASESAAAQIPSLKPQTLRNGQSAQWNGLKIDAVPAYNLQHKRPDGAFYHPKGYGNGYVIHFGNFRLYIAGDTENIPEMAALAGVDAAFLPKNLPYTMTDEMFIDAAKRLRPKTLYPYHYETADKAALQKAVGPDIKIK